MCDIVLRCAVLLSVGWMYDSAQPGHPAATGLLSSEDKSAPASASRRRGPSVRSLAAPSTQRAVGPHLGSAGVRLGSGRSTPGAATAPPRAQPAMGSTFRFVASRFGRLPHRQSGTPLRLASFLSDVFFTPRHPHSSSSGGRDFSGACAFHSGSLSAHTSPSFSSILSAVSRLLFCFRVVIFLRQTRFASVKVPLQLSHLPE